MHTSTLQMKSRLTGDGPICPASADCILHPGAARKRLADHVSLTQGYGVQWDSFAGPFTQGWLCTAKERASIGGEIAELLLSSMIGS